VWNRWAKERKPAEFIFQIHKAEGLLEPAITRQYCRFAFDGETVTTNVRLGRVWDACVSAYVGGL